MSSSSIVVTGASSGIGRELAIQLADTGREIWLVGRDAGRLEETADLVRGRGAVAHVVPLDLTDIERTGNYLTEHFPEGKVIDEVYLAAAVSSFGEFHETLPEDWERLYHTNLLSPIQWTHHFYRNMVPHRKGRIVLISSLAGYTGYPTATAYAAMKGGLLGLFRSLCFEAGMNGVSLHLVSPGYVKTRIYEAAIFRKTSYEQTMKLINEMGFPMITPEKSARLIIRGVARNKAEFALPGYASLLKWIAPRFPWMIGMVHRKMMKSFRRSA
ncbi:MAG: SDR family NAD(P)-dependent oxidoreductase [Akkermansiaceae bacterium]|nr:SDR family NAD(P)-dependent oxidoreductase [Akkermansiaceae bacterium]